LGACEMECLLPRVVVDLVGDDEVVGREVCTFLLLVFGVVVVVVGAECDRECRLLKVKTLADMTATGGGISAFFEDEDEDDDDFCLVGDDDDGFLVGHDEFFCISCCFFVLLSSPGFSVASGNGVHVILAHRLSKCSFLGHDEDAVYGLLRLHRPGGEMGTGDDTKEYIAWKNMVRTRLSRL
jgi:hypothetical protein